MLNEKKNQITIYKNSINLLNFQHSRVHKGAVIIFFVFKCIHADF